MVKKIFVVLFVAFVAVSANAYAISDGSVTLTTDNHYDFYISNSETAVGSFIGSSYSPSGEDWQNAESWNFNLTPGVTNYLHVVGKDDFLSPENVGNWAGFLGEFTLNNSNYRFENGTNKLLTNVDDWKMYGTGLWGNSVDVIPTYLTYNHGDDGTNGSSPWGLIGGIDTGAYWIWSNEDGVGDLGTVNNNPKLAYFSAKINTVPEPISTALFLLGGATLAVRRIRKAGKK